MLNTKNILRAAALLGTCAVAAAESPCVVTPSQVHTVPMLAEQGLEASKLRAGVVLTRGVNELLALQGTSLVLVRDVMSAPKQLVVATEVVDFAVLPAVNGLSRVVVVGAEGLRISTVIDGGVDVGATLSFNTVLSEAWEDVTLVDAAASGDVTHIVGAAGSQVRRGKFDSGSLQALPTLQAEGSILKLAISDAHSLPGLELALHTTVGIGLYLEGSVMPYVFLPDPLGAVVKVDRIPRGAGVRDSFGVWVRDPVMDLFVEVVEAQISPPTFSGGQRLNDVSYGAIGIAFQPQISTLETDMVVATQTNELVALHGAVQVPGGYPFWPDPTQFSMHSVEALLGDVNVGDLRVACADFDGDGDGDVAIANNAGEDACFAFVRNDCSYADAEAVVTPYVDTELAPDFLVGSNQMGVQQPLEVRQPPIFDGAPPTHVRVRVFIREYYDPLPAGFAEQPPVSPEEWWESAPTDLPVTQYSSLPGSNAPHQALLDIAITTPLPVSIVTAQQLTTGNVLAYFEFVPMRKDANGVVLQRANATVWVGAVEGGLLTALICNDEPDEFSNLYPNCSLGVGEDGGQLITEMHRRKVIRPIPPSTVPQ